MNSGEGQVLQEFKFKLSSILLILILLLNFMMVFPAGSVRVQAGFWDSNKDSITTVLKGLLMLWIMNLINDNTDGDSNENPLTSTIREGLNLDEQEEQEQEEEESNEEDISEENDEDQISDVTITPEENDLEQDIENMVEDDKFQLNEEEDKMLKLINQERNNQGLDNLRIDEGLTEVARLKAQDMNTNDYFEHFSPEYGSPFDMLKERNINYLLAGENLADAPTVEKGFQELMNSSEHKDNILESRYDKVGIGIIPGGEYGLTIVQIFTESSAL